MDAYAERSKTRTATAILTGYYAAYYTNAGKKAKSPDELIKKLYARKQSAEAGLKDIEKFKEAERRSFEDVSKHSK